jgi:hypothetical protein
MSENEWKEHARVFGTNWRNAFGGDSVTSYLHCFVYHLGFFFEKYDIVVFANFATESRHKFNKFSSNHASSGLRTYASGKGLTYQELARSTRMTFVEEKWQPKPGRPRNNNWTERSLVRFCDCDDFPLKLELQDAN